MLHRTSNFPGYLTSAGLAQRLGITLQTLCLWKRQGRGPPRIEITRRVFLYEEGAVAEWLKSREVAPAPATPAVRHRARGVPSNP
jgi:hypothetical protein